MGILNKKKSLSLIGIIVFLTLIYFPIFLHLDRLPLDNFDEARLAVSALEMHENGNWLIPHFGGKPDMWSTKPPLMIWAQTICIKIFGVNELAIRLPSALAALFTVFLLVFFCAHVSRLSKPRPQILISRLGKPRYVGVLAALVLISTKGFIVKHVSRTGDYDALLVFFMTAQAFLFWLFTETENEEKKKKYILLFGLSVALSVLTKSVVGLMFMPAFFIYALIQKSQFFESAQGRNSSSDGKSLDETETGCFSSSDFPSLDEFSKKRKSILFFRWTWLAILGALALISGYYFLRENYNPGYLRAVWENELGGRYLGTLEKHKEPFWWYFERLISKQFLPWIYFLPFAIWLGIKSDLRTKRLTLFAVLTAFSFLFIISISNTKLEHYDAPIYPFLALLTGIGFVKISDTLKVSDTWKFALFLLIFTYPYYKIIDSIYLKAPTKQYNEYAWFMDRNSDTKTYFVAVKNYNAHLEFYKQAYNRKGYKIEATYPKNLETGNTAMFCQNDVKKMIDKHYEYQIKDKDRGCFLAEITAKR